MKNKGIGKFESEYLEKRERTERRQNFKLFLFALVFGAVSGSLVLGLSGLESISSFMRYSLGAIIGLVFGFIAYKIAKRNSDVIFKQQ